MEEGIRLGVVVVLFILAGVGLPYCLLRAAKALRDRDDHRLGMFTFGSCLCGGYLAIVFLLVSWYIIWGVQ